MPSQTVKGITIQYGDEGQGIPLVLLHGFPLDRTIFDPQVRELKPVARVITPDFRGFGASPPAGPFTLENLADDVHGLLSRIGALPCVLGGLSMGGYVAFQFVKKYPADLKGLILIDTKPQADDAAAQQRRVQMAEVARTIGSRAVAGMMFPKMIAQANKRGPVGDRLQAIMRACPPETIALASYAMRDRPDFSADLPGLPVPTLLIYGEHDELTPPSLAQDLARQIPRNRLVVIPGAGHVSTLERPDPVNQAIREFLHTL